MSEIVYFAYGSNMLHRRILARVPSARPRGRALLTGYELKWHKVGQDGSGKCDIVRTESPDALVVGVVYEFDRAHKGPLDRAEGRGLGYDETELTVELGGAPVTARAYLATRVDAGIQPFTWYRALVVAGAAEHGLPADYIESLRRVGAVEDADGSRSARHFAMADAGTDWPGARGLS